MYFVSERLNTDMLGRWRTLCEYISKIQLFDEKDNVNWGLNKIACYTTKSMYKWLEKPPRGCNFKWIWKAKLPLKIQIFLW